MASTNKMGCSPALNGRSKVCTFDLNFTTDGAGAATMIEADCYGIQSVTHGADGVYVVVLNRKVAKLLLCYVGELAQTDAIRWNTTSTTTTSGKTSITFTRTSGGASTTAASKTVAGTIRVRL